MEVRFWDVARSPSDLTQCARLPLAPFLGGLSPPSVEMCSQPSLLSLLSKDDATDTLQGVCDADDKDVASLCAPPRVPRLLLLYRFSEGEGCHVVDGSCNSTGGELEHTRWVQTRTSPLPLMSGSSGAVPAGMFNPLVCGRYNGVWRRQVSLSLGPAFRQGDIQPLQLVISSTTSTQDSCLGWSGHLLLPDLDVVLLVSGTLSPPGSKRKHLLSFTLQVDGLLPGVAQGSAGWARHLTAEGTLHTQSNRGSAGSITALWSTAVKLILPPTSQGAMGDKEQGTKMKFLQRVHNKFLDGPLPTPSPIGAIAAADIADWRSWSAIDEVEKQLCDIEPDGCTVSVPPISREKGRRAKPQQMLVASNGDAELCGPWAAGNSKDGSWATGKDASAPASPPTGSVNVVFASLPPQAQPEVCGEDKATDLETKVDLAGETSSSSSALRLLLKGEVLAWDVEVLSSSSDSLCIGVAPPTMPSGNALGSTPMSWGLNTAGRIRHANSSDARTPVSVCVGDVVTVMVDGHSTTLTFAVNGTIVVSVRADVAGCAPAVSLGTGDR